jgi:hypothetical protein
MRQTTETHKPKKESDMLTAYRAATTYEAYNVFWECEGKEDEPVGMLWSRLDILEYATLHNVSPIWK